MTQPLPKWVMKRYSKLWTKFGTKEFQYSDASNALLDDNIVSIVLSALRKAGWMEATLNSDDSRRRNYKLKSPEKAVLEISNSYKRRAGELTNEKLKRAAIL